MAAGFREVFGDALVTDFLDSSLATLPSPNQLRRRIIVKAKKLPEGTSDRDWKALIVSDESENGNVTGLFQGLQVRQYCVVQQC